MIKLKFKIDKYHLAYKLWMANVLYTKKIKPEWKALCKKIKEEYEAYPGYCLFDIKYMGYGLTWANYGEKNERVIRDEPIIKRIFGEIFKSVIFQKKYLECQKYKKEIQVQWRKNKLWLLEFEKITGLSSDETLEVFILHPEMETGSYMDSKQIDFGNKEYYKNYNFIGLCHEILHYLTEDQYLLNLNKTEDEQWLLHSLICLAADEELRKRMSGSKHYLQPNAPYFENKRLTKLVKNSLPIWSEYMLNNKKPNILELFKKMRKSSRLLKNLP